MDDQTGSQELQQLTLKIQSEILERVLPAVQQVVDNAVSYMASPDDDEAITDYLRELAVELTIDEMVRVLTRDPQAPSRIYALRDKDGLVLDTLIACYNELNADKARLWYAHQLGISPEEHRTMTQTIPRQLDL